MRANFPAGTPFWRHSSFDALLGKCGDRLGPLPKFLPQSPGLSSYDGQEHIESVHSTYKDHGYGNFFYALTRVLKPRQCVELGVLGGFSLLSVAAALRDNGMGRIHGVDLFENYPHRNALYSRVQDHVRTCGLEKWSLIESAEAASAHAQHTDVDMLHVDLSNDGDTYRSTFGQWSGKVRQAILLEGGSVERDSVEWMKEYRKPPIAPAIEEIRLAYPEWTILVLTPFPSVTVALRRNLLPQ